MKFYFAHNGVDDGHPDVYTNTVDTTVPGPKEAKHTNYVQLASVGLIVVVLVVVGVNSLLKSRKVSITKPEDTE